MRLEGLILPVTTPFVEGRPATDRLSENMGRYARHGADGYLVLGSTGEAALLDEGEKLAVVRAARAAAGSKPLLAGVGLESTAGTVQLARLAAAQGADAVLVITPFYFRGRMTEEALVRHFSTVADASPVPILLYNVPVYTGLVIPVGAVERLATHGNVVGLKDSAGDLAWLLDVLARVPPGFRVLCGSAAVLLPALEAGACGGVLAAADVLPEAFARLYRLHRTGPREDALALQQRLLAAARRLVGVHGVAGVKAGLDARGLWGGDPRPPLLPAAEPARREIEGVLAELVAAGVIGALRL